MNSLEGQRITWSQARGKRMKPGSIKLWGLPLYMGCSTARLNLHPDLTSLTTLSAAIVDLTLLGLKPTLPPHLGKKQQCASAEIP